jgi:hypothetical protein
MEALLPYQQDTWVTLYPNSQEGVTHYEKEAMVIYGGV